MNAKRISLLALLSLVLLTAVVGCGRRTVPVSGKVTLDGKPVENIRVVFQLEGEAAMKETDSRVGVATGLTDAEGKYSLSLLRMNADGAVPGDYAVFIFWEDPNAAEALDRIAHGTGGAAESPYKLPSEANSGKLRFVVPVKGTKEANFDFRSEEEAAAASESGN